MRLFTSRWYKTIRIILTYIDVILLLLALNEQSIANHTASSLFASAAAFLNEIGTTLGVVTMHKFKSFFFANKNQLQDITSTTDDLLTRMMQYKKYFADATSILDLACKMENSGIIVVKNTNM